MPDALPDGWTLRYQHRGRAYCYNPADDMPRSRGVTVAVVGASGNMGRQIASSIASHRRDFAGLGEMTLQFVGRREGHSLPLLVGLCSELRDAFDDFCPHLEVVCELAAVRADIIVVAAGATMSTKYRTHQDLARANAHLFEEHALMLKEHNEHSIVFIVSNPVEFGVDTFVGAGFDPSRVMGTGAYLDSLRFRREIASEVGVPRQHVTGLVLGMHGLNMVPCWSTVKLASVYAQPKFTDRLEKMKEEGLSRLPKDQDSFREMADQVRDLVLHDNALAAAALVSRQPADVRAALRRYISFFSGPVYPRIGIGEKVGRLISRMLSGQDMFTAGQIRTTSDNFIDGYPSSAYAVGAPVSVSARGVFIDKTIVLDPREVEAIKASAQEAKRFHNVVSAIKSLRQLARAQSAKNGSAPH